MRSSRSWNAGWALMAERPRTAHAVDGKQVDPA